MNTFFRRLLSSTPRDDPFSQFGPVLKPSVYNKIRDPGTLKPNHLSEFGPIRKKKSAKKDILSKETILSPPHHQSVKVKEPSVFPMMNDTRPLCVSPPPDHSSVLRLPFTHSQDCPSVSRVLAATMSEQSRANLARWEAEKIALLGADGFKKYKTEMFSRGKTLHSILENFLETSELPRPSDLDDEVSKRHLVSVSQVIRCVDRPLALESAVHHKNLGYSGIVDCVAVIGNTVTLIDWKTSERVKNSAAALYDNPLQVAAYVGAINADPAYEGLGSISHGAVVVIYNTGYPAMLHTFDQEQLAKYWKLWCERLNMYKENIVFKKDKNIR